MFKQKKLPIPFILLALVVFLFIIGSVVWFYSNHRLVYTTNFINSAEITIPSDIFKTIDPDHKLEIRITKGTEFNTYTAHFETEYETYTETNVTRSGTRGSAGSSGGPIDDILIHKTPRTQNMKITVTPKSSEPFNLDVYELKY